jgi:hypothetical protein
MQDSIPDVLTETTEDELVQDNVPRTATGLPLGSSAVAIIVIGAAPTRLKMVEGDRDTLATGCMQTADTGEVRVSVEPGTTMDASTFAVPWARQVSSALEEMDETVGVADCQLAEGVTSSAVPSAYMRVAVSCAVPFTDMGVPAPEMLSVGEVHETGNAELR